MLIGIAVFVGLAATLSTALVVTARMLGDAEPDVADRIEALLPRIQCAQCGYAGCRPYAEAIAAERAAINLCPPGGIETVEKLADLLGMEAAPLDKSRGDASMDRVARIEESACIGCNLCLRACPVDAIVGIQQMMHTVLRSACTGCELCLPPCPVNCIDMVLRDA